MASLRDDSLALRLCYKRSVPLGRFPTFYDCATNIPSLWDGSYVLRLCYKRSVPLGRFPTFYDCATNISSLRDGSPGLTIVLQTFRPSATVSFGRASSRGRV